MYSVQLPTTIWASSGNKLNLANKHPQTVYRVIDGFKICWVDIIEMPDIPTVVYNISDNHLHYLRSSEITRGTVYATINRFLDEGGTDIIKWHCQNCKGKIGFKYTNKWYFKNKEDMIAFSLRWG